MASVTVATFIIVLIDSASSVVDPSRVCVSEALLYLDLRLSAAVGAP